MQSGQQQDNHRGQQATAGQRYCVGVVGAGSIGCFLGAYLCQDSALDVKFFGREAMALELAAHGLRASSYRQHHYFAQPVAFYSSLSSLIECDLVLLTVKANALVPMLLELKRYLRPEIPVVAMQNGIGIAEMLSQDLANPILRAIIPFNIIKPKAGHFQQATAGNIIWQQNTHKLVNYVIAVFNRLKLSVDVCLDITAAEYGKLLLNLNNALNAITDIPLKQQLLDRDSRLILALAMQEWLAICAQAGVKPLRYTLLPNTLLPWLLRMPTSIFKRIAHVLLAIDPAARSSMWDDIQAKKRTEIMFLNGAVMRLGQHYHLPTPANSVLVDYIKQLEMGTFHPQSTQTLLKKIRQHA
ncbi:2-dehydropantoate 2-reductase [Rheinheimera baltica]|uniref:2-dehydropantoate 2-reductase n=1 Tax=Rheinheimera baltica TaxID=67576 RepID=UPI00273E2834|nr:2-dehydropantoate 2-reductase [Rheinheimera baltica]MDP5190468.1 2-dehydropantoate 2-reductase [Rheinheimera baltica]